MCNKANHLVGFDCYNRSLLTHLNLFFQQNIEAGLTYNCYLKINQIKLILFDNQFRFGFEKWHSM